MDSFLIGIACTGIFFYLCQIAAIQLRRIGTRHPYVPPRDNADYLPPVTVLKPVKGLEPNLEENLLSFIRQDYPDFEIVLGVQEMDDPALPLLRRLGDLYPDRVKLLVRDLGRGYNPKVSNLVGMIPESLHDLCVISDSNVRVSPNYLRCNVGYFKNPRVGLVTNLVRGLGGSNVSALMENLHLNSFIAGNMCLSDVLIKKKLVVGKSMFFRRSQVSALGGFEQFLDYLAEDYLMGKVYSDAGFEVVISPYMVDTWNRDWTFTQFANRFTRWAKMRWHINKPAYLGEAFINFSFWILVYALHQRLSAQAVELVLLVWTVKVLGDLIVNRTIGTPLPWYAMLLSPLKDLVVALLYPLAILSSRTSWRGHTLKVKKGTLLVPVKNHVFFRRS